MPRLYRLLATYALARGAWRGVRQAFRKRRPLTLSEADRILKQLWLEPIAAQLNQQSPFLFDIVEGPVDPRLGSNAIPIRKAATIPVAAPSNHRPSLGEEVRQ